MPLTNLGTGAIYSGPGAYHYPISSWPGGALIFVNSATGLDNRSRLKFTGTPASVGAQPASSLGPQGDPEKPLATVFGPNGALSFVKAGRGDKIVVAPGHVEALAAGTTQVPGGVSIIGIGYGSQRPQFQWSANANTLLNSNGAGVQLSNCIFDLTQIAAVTLGFQVQHSGWQFVNNCRIVMASATNQASAGIKLMAGADDFIFANSELDATAAAGAVTGISNPAANNINRPKILNSFINGDFSTANISLLSTGIKDFLIKYNTLRNLNAAFVTLNLAAGNTITGIVSYNDVMMAGTTQTTFVNGGGGTGMAFLQNFAWDTKASTNSGILIPAAGTL